MVQKVIYSAHVYILLILSTGFMVHVLLHPVILSSSHRDSWVSVIASALPFLFWTLLLYFLYKKVASGNLFSLLFQLHPWISFGFCSLLGVYFFLTALITFKYTVYWANANYTYDTPVFFVVMPFAFICFWASYKGIRTISSMAVFLLPLIVIFGFLVGIGNMKNKDYTLMFPVFEHGYKGFLVGIMYSCASLFEIIYFLFLTPFLKERIKAKWLFVAAMGILILALGPLIGGIAEFGAEEAAKMKVPAYDQWKLLTIGIHITRLDFLSIYQWLSGAFIRVSLSVFILEQLLSFKKKKPWLLPMIYFLLVTGVLIPLNFKTFFSLLYSYYFPGSLVFLLFIFGILFLLSRTKTKGDAV